MTTKEIGDFGEEAAVEYLEENGYEVCERNFKAKCGEIDIIAEKDGCIVFVEVKTRKSNFFGEPSEYVDYRKQERIRKTAMIYVDIENTDMRFDVIEIFYDKKQYTYFLTNINHIENAF